LVRARRIGLVLLLAACMAPAGTGAGVVPASKDLDTVTGQIICDCGCSNLTIKDCTCGKADRVRAEVAARLAAGQTPDQVLQAYVDDFGEQILAAPKPEGFNLVGWLLPFGAVLLGGSILVLILRRWAKVPWSEAALVPPLGAANATPPDPSFLRRVQEEMDRTES
jgi:cytochrome c-type biogenesis protein CcmH/NrfF